MVLGIILFEVFMTGLFLLKTAYIISTCMAPLVVFTLYWSWRMYHRFEPLSTFVSLSLIADVQKGEPAERILRVGYDGVDGGVTRSQASGHGPPSPRAPGLFARLTVDLYPPSSNLNRRRYANNQDDLYLAPADDRTD
jgi:hypothetical protein